MTVLDFLTAHHLCPSQISAQSCLAGLLDGMKQGLGGAGNIPMIPSYLSTNTTVPRDARCCVVDAGGTNLRSALAIFDEAGHCRIQDIRRIPMPGTQGMLGKQEFYAALADQIRLTHCTERIGLCFSYNVMLQRTLDGVLHAWCKEVQVPEALGHPVGASLAEALGTDSAQIHVLNDSVAAMLGVATPERRVQVGIILGTGINVCYEERCDAIPKVESDLRGESMIISTEVGEFDGIPKSDFDLALFDSTEDPQLAHAEKQCAGGYLGDLICRVWQGAAAEGLIGEEFRRIQVPLQQISALLEGQDTAIPHCDGAIFIAQALIHRAAKIAAILCAGPVLRCTEPGGGVNIAVEGSQFEKLRGFRGHFQAELEALLAPYGISYAFCQTGNACLKGAALAAFAQMM